MADVAAQVNLAPGRRLSRETGAGEARRETSATAVLCMPLDRAARDSQRGAYLPTLIPDSLSFSIAHR